MSKYPKVLLKMNAYLHSFFPCIEQVIHPAAGREVMQKKKKRSATGSINPKASPDSQNIREMVRKEDSFRRNPAP